MTDRTPIRARVHAPGAELDVRPYDFEKPEVIGGPLRARLETALEAWARQLGLHLTAKTRAVVDVAVVPFEIQSFAAFLASTEAPSLYATASIGARRALYRVPLPEARYWAARMIGAAATATDGERQLTAVERALAQHVADEHLAELRVATGDRLPAPSVESFAVEPAAGLDDDALAVVVPVGLLRRGERRQVSLALPVDTILDAFGAAGGRQDPAEVAARVHAHLGVTTVEVALRFDDTRVGPTTALDLAEGDLIPLAHPAHRPLVVTLDGAPVLRAAVGGNGERLACIVVEANGAAA